MATTADANDETFWILELESLLLTDCDLDDIRKVCNGKAVPENLRSEVWLVCLGLRGKEEYTKVGDEIYDLPEQTTIRKDCQVIVDRLGNEEEDKLSVISDLESVLTKYSKTTGISYSSDNGWLEVLEPLLSLRLPSSQLYEYFRAIQNTYIPKYCGADGQLFHMLRLLLLYHDPHLCSLLDTKKVTPDCYASHWFRSLFSATCNLEVTLAMWDIYFQVADPFLILFLSLVILVNAKEQILTMKEEPRHALIEILKSAPCDLEMVDVEDFCFLAQYYMSRTPVSFTRDFHDIIFSNSCDENAKEANLSQALCLPVSPWELVFSSKPKLNKDNALKYFVVDCRPAEQYNSGHLPNGFHLDSSLMLQEPASFNTAVQALFAAQKQAIKLGSVAGGEHVCFMGSGREEEDQYVHMVVASFLQKQLPFVSLAKGGYEALHNFMLDSLNSGLTDHCSKSCIICTPAVHENNGANGTENEDFSFLDKITTLMKSKSAVVREKLVDYITNPPQSAERKEKSAVYFDNFYPVTVTQHYPGSDEKEEQEEEVGLQTWLKKPDVIETFKCDEIKDNGYMYPSHLVVTKTHVFILREMPYKKGFAKIIARRSLLSVVKITSKRRHPELITFKYGYSDSAGNFTVTSMDRFLIPNAGDATKLIKQQIVKLDDNTQETSYH
ncbi:TBC1 domain family member 23-like [Limulus polyphemus]|uniref:TBC1 domain family member 23 n=1 Tax=Limulus polyphemus TaxID=6850 RepID=A0ABM1B4U4_LIMPO|nr:TBC1 domain family member 23-like [Limulus polyphemus]